MNHDLAQEIVAAIFQRWKQSGLILTKGQDDDTLDQEIQVATMIAEQHLDDADLLRD